MITFLIGTNLCVEHYAILQGNTLYTILNKFHEQPENKMKLTHGTKHEHDMFTQNI